MNQTNIAIRLQFDILNQRNEFNEGEEIKQKPIDAQTREEEKKNRNAKRSKNKRRNTKNFVQNNFVTNIYL